MPSTKYTRIEITTSTGPEAEAILQEKTLKKLASELILQGEAFQRGPRFYQEERRIKKNRRAPDSSTYMEGY